MRNIHTTHAEFSLGTKLNGPLPHDCQLDLLKIFSLQITTYCIPALRSNVSVSTAASHAAVSTPPTYFEHASFCFVYSVLLDGGVVAMTSARPSDSSITPARMTKKSLSLPHCSAHDGNIRKHSNMPAPQVGACGGPPSLSAPCGCSPSLLGDSVDAATVCTTR